MIPPVMATWRLGHTVAIENILHSTMHEGLLSLANYIRDSSPTPLPMLEYTAANPRPPKYTVANVSFTVCVF
jgi:hypothetical protein